MTQLKLYREQQVFVWITHLSKIGRIQTTGEYTAADLMAWLPEPAEITEEDIYDIIVANLTTKIDLAKALQAAKAILSKLKGE